VSGACQAPPVTCATDSYVKAGACEKCDVPMSNCATCSDGTNCLTFTSPYSLVGTTCTMSCASNSYASGTSCLLCSNAVANCETCTSTPTCLTCSASYTLVGTACQLTPPTCTSGQYINGNTC